MIEEAADRGVLLEALEAPDALILQLLQGRKPRWPGSDDTPQPSKCLGHRLSAAHTHLARWSHKRFLGSAAILEASWLYYSLWI